MILDQLEEQINSTKGCALIYKTLKEIDKNKTLCRKLNKMYRGMKPEESLDVYLFSKLNEIFSFEPGKSSMNFSDIYIKVFVENLENYPDMPEIRQKDCIEKLYTLYNSVLKDFFYSRRSNELNPPRNLT